MTDLYLRKVSLIVTAPPAQGPTPSGTALGSTQNGLDLSALQIIFKTTQADVDAPNTAVIRVMNLSDATALKVQNEFSGVTLQAGYQTGNFGIIFQGSIKQVRRGRLNATDKYLDIYAADGDQAHTSCVVNQTLAAGSSLQDQVNAITSAMAKFDISKGSLPLSLGTGGTLPRNKVLFGMAKLRMNDVCNSAGCSWSVQNGKVVVIPLTGYLDGQAVVLNSQTGMIGIPEQTNDGIAVTSLLNPLIKIGTRVQIDNASINQVTINQQGFPSYTDLSFPASVTADGFYRTLVAEHRGDSRGNDWYTDLTCLALDASAAAGNSVKIAG